MENGQLLKEAEGHTAGIGGTLDCTKIVVG